MTEVGRQRQHLLTDVLAVRVPKRQPTHRKAMTQVVDTRPAMIATIDPTKLSPQLVEDPFNLPSSYGLAEPVPTTTDEER